MKILVVDDQELNRSMLRFMLENDGYEVIDAEDGEDALVKASESRPDIVLLDVIMPKMDGFETAPKLKEIAGDAHLPIIFITALDDQKSMLRCLEVGGDDFLGKPFDKVVLSAKIKAHARTRLLSKRVYKQNKALKYHQNVVQREHEIVEHIFSNALGRQLGDLPGVDAHLSPATMFNGDLFLAARGPTGGLYLFMGDFTGHGLASAVGALPVSKAFYSMTSKGFAVSDLAYEINEILLNILPNYMFCAAAIAEISASGQSLSIWNGGLPSVYLVEGNKICYEFQSQHLALGVAESHEFDSTTENFSTSLGQRLLFHTDGLTESSNEKGEMLGEVELQRFITENPDFSTQTLTQWLDDFSAEAEQQDDVSVAVVTCIEQSDLKGEKTDLAVSRLPWEYSVRLDPEALKNTDPPAQIVDMITAIEAYQNYRSQLFLLVSEMFNNAFEHGVLGLDSNVKDEEDGFLKYYDQRMERLDHLTEGFVDVHLSSFDQGRSVKIRLTDSGKGFDYSTALAMCDEKTHGRGLSLIKEIASQVSFENNGTTIEALFSLDV